jgi:uncharacterized membrane protein
VLSVTLFTLMAICIKAVAPDVPPGQAVFFRSTFAIPVILAWLVYTHDIRHGLDTQNPMGHLWRGLVGVTAMGLGFTALGLLPLPEAVALGYAAPLLAVIFAAMFLGEEVRAFRLTAVVLGLVGVVIVLAPRLTLTSLEVADKLQTIGAMAAILGAVFAALAQVFVRKLVTPRRRRRSSSTSRSPPPCSRSPPSPSAGSCRPRPGRAPDRRGPARRHRPDPAHRGLPPRRRLGHRALRIRLDAARHRLRLLALRRGPDAHHARRRRADRRRRPLHHLARAPLGLERGRARRAITPQG